MLLWFIAANVRQAASSGVIVVSFALVDDQLERRGHVPRDLPTELLR
jgi:hypothetical protein